MSTTSTVYEHSTRPRKALLHVYTKPCSAKIQPCAEQKFLKGLKHELVVLQNTFVPDYTVGQVYCVCALAVTKTTEGKGHHTITWAGELTHSHRSAPFGCLSMNAKENPKEFWAHLQNECNVNYYSSFKIRTAVTSLNLCFLGKSCLIYKYLLIDLRSHDL